MRARQDAVGGRDPVLPQLPVAAIPEVLFPYLVRYQQIVLLYNISYCYHCVTLVQVNSQGYFPFNPIQHMVE